MGVKVPDSGRGMAVGVAVAEAVAVGLGVAEGEAVGMGVRVAEGVDSNAGPSAAATIKLLVNVRRIPAASRQERVIL